MEGMKKRKTNSSVENRNLPSLMVYGRSALKIEKGGDVSAAIENLVEAGFLAERSDRAARGSIHVNKRVFASRQTIAIHYP